MTAVVPQPTSVRELLFGADEVAATDTLTGSLRDHGVAALVAHQVHGLTGGAAKAVESEVATVVNGFLGLDLIDLATAGWSKHAAMTAAARRTLASPESEELVALATHRITSSHRPSVDLCVDGARIGVLNVALTIAFDIEGLVAVVRNARLTSLRCGTCTATGSLALEEAVVARRRCRVDLPGAVELRSGLPLLPAGERQARPVRPARRA